MDWISAPLRKKAVVHPDFLFFEAITLETDFQEPGKLAGWIEDVLASTAELHQWTDLVRVGRHLPAARQALEQAADDGALFAAQQRVLALMTLFQRECGGIRSSIRPIAWRYFWEGEQKPLNHWVPKSFNKQMCTAFLPHFLTTGWDHGFAVYALMWFDPRTCTDPQLTSFRNACRMRLGRRKTARGYRQFPLLESTVWNYAFVLNLTIRGAAFGSIRNEGTPPIITREALAELRRDWNGWLAGREPSEALVRLFLDQYRQDYGRETRRRGKRSIPEFSPDIVTTALKNLRTAFGHYLQPCEDPS